MVNHGPRVCYRFVVLTCLILVLRTSGNVKIWLAITTLERERGRKSGKERPFKIPHSRREQMLSFTFLKLILLLAEVGTTSRAGKKIHLVKSKRSPFSTSETCWKGWTRYFKANRIIRNIEGRNREWSQLVSRQEFCFSPDLCRYKELYLWFFLQGLATESCR